MLMDAISYGSTAYDYKKAESFCLGSIQILSGFRLASCCNHTVRNYECCPNADRVTSAPIMRASIPDPWLLNRSMFHEGVDSAATCTDYAR
jgi:hypothetical protein